MVRGSYLLFMIGAFSVGCFPSLEGQSAGLTGCRDSDLQISDVDSGLASETWVATCNGKRYVCSQPTMGPTAYHASCTPAGDSAAQAAPSSAAKPPPPSNGVVEGRARPPTGAGGFQFGQTREEVQSACTGQNFEFSATDKGGARCSGLLANLPFKAAAQFSFCGDTLCKVALVVDPAELQGSLLKSYRTIDEALTKKYGKPAQHRMELPAECNEDKIRECLDDGAVSLQRLWTWPTVNVQLSLNQPDGATQPRFVAIYSQARSNDAATDAL